MEDKRGEDQAFNDAFDDFAKAGPSADEQPAERGEQDTSPADAIVAVPVAAADADGDGDAALTLDDAKARLLELQQYKKSNEGRVGGLQRKINDLSTQLNTLIATAPQSAPQGAAPQPRAVDASWERMYREYPEIAGAVEKRLNDTLGQVLPEVGRVQSQLRESAVKQVLEHNVNSLLDDHPDAPAIAGSAEFKQWLDQQPSYVRHAAINSNDAREASDVLSRFKHSKQAQLAQIEQIRSQRQQQLNQSAGVPTRRAIAPASRAIPESYEDAFKFFANKSRD